MQKQEIRQCQNCKQEFRIEPEDFLFYEKIGVPPPTFCPMCRLQRRMASYNIFKLYKRKCDLCLKMFVSRFSPDKPYRVYCPPCWWSDGWDPMEYGRDYNFSRPFFEQFRDLWREVPVCGLSIDLKSTENSPYNNNVGYLKDCYLIFEGGWNERCMYGHFVIHSNDCVDCYFIIQSELSYNLFHGFKDYKCIASQYTTETNNSAFLWQCTNCQNCFASANLRNKEYHIFNKPHAKEDYFEKISEYDLGSYQIYSNLKEEAHKHRLKYPVKTFWNEFSVNTSGLLVFSSKNCQKCFEVNGAEDSKFVSYIEKGPVKDSYDYTQWGDNTELVYEAFCAGENIRNVKFGVETGINSYDMDYITLVVGSSNLFGCVGVRNKSYVIFNKQYSSEEYKAMRSKIIQHMNDMPYKDKKGSVYRYGEFFPIEIMPFAYNETPAMIYDPLGKEEILASGYHWQEDAPSEHPVTVRSQDLPDHIKDIKDSIFQEYIGCKTCGKAYRIIPQELEFYRKINVPLPRQCFFCRLMEMVKDQPHPLRLYQRKCQCMGKESSNGVYKNSADHFHGSGECFNEFETSYFSDRPDIVYCRECYQSEVQ